MTKLITSPRFAESTGLPYRLCVLTWQERAGFRRGLQAGADGQKVEVRTHEGELIRIVLMCRVAPWFGPGSRTT